MGWSRFTTRPFDFWLSLSLTVLKLELSRVKSHLRWIFSHAIKPKKYITAMQGYVSVRGNSCASYNTNSFTLFQQPYKSWDTKVSWFNREVVVNPFCTRNERIRKGKPKKRKTRRLKRKRPVRYKMRKTKLRRKNTPKRKINYINLRPRRIAKRRRRKYFF